MMEMTDEELLKEVGIDKKFHRKTMLAAKPLLTEWAASRITTVQRSDEFGPVKQGIQLMSTQLKPFEQMLSQLAPAQDDAKKLMKLVKENKPEDTSGPTVTDVSDRDDKPTDVGKSSSRPIVTEAD